MSRKMWELDIYRQQGNTDALVATHDFHNLISLRIAIIENRGRSFVVRGAAARDTTRQDNSSRSESPRCSYQNRYARLQA